MTPEELAQLHPRLYHITSNSYANICKHGLLSTSALLDLFEIPSSERSPIEDNPRQPGIVLRSKDLFDMTLNDNVPLKTTILSKCLEDGLTVTDWMHILNRRVYFWTTEENMNNHLQAFLRNRNDNEPPVEVLVIDTLSFATAHLNQIEFCAINSGVAIRNAAKRGLQTFTPMTAHDYKTWRKLRGKLDNIKEVTVLNKVKDIETHVVEVLRKGNRKRSIHDV